MQDCLKESKDSPGRYRPVENHSTVKNRHVAMGGTEGATAPQTYALPPDLHPTYTRQEHIYCISQSRTSSRETPITKFIIHHVSEKKTSTHIIGYKLRNKCLILIIFDIKIPHII